MPRKATTCNSTHYWVVNGGRNTMVINHRKIANIYLIGMWSGRGCCLDKLGRVQIISQNSPS